MTERQKYIANCIDRILEAECLRSNEWQRTIDLAEAVYLAATQGEEAAHQYLIQLCKDAEAGKYKASE